MNRSEPAAGRSLKTDVLHADLVIVGGGMAGVCCAITAARAGVKVVLVQDRPVLGGNASSEVRLWVLGATCHMASNLRWAREGGVHDEILVENLYRNPEGNPLIFDTVLLEKVIEEKNIALLLNTAVFEVAKDEGNPDRIASITAFCSQNSTRYELRAPLFADCSGDGIVGFLSGAAFRMGAEKREEFGESFAPGQEYGELLGHSIYFYSKDVGTPVKFVPPSYAIKNVPDRIPRFRAFNTRTYGCRLWWIEYGGRLDTIHDTESIKWELWKVVYGVWDYIKNSGEHPDSANLTLEWVGAVPGKRESRRFEGDYMLTQNDVLRRPNFDDAVAFGGWSIDLHPADGVFSARSGCNQYLSKGVYQIPYRTLYSRNIDNLFIAGRIMSSSHVAFGSTRVMGTGAHCGQAVGIAAAICREQTCLPRDAASGPRLGELQLRLHRVGQHIPRFAPADPANLAERAQVSASSTLTLAGLPASDSSIEVAKPQAQMIPLREGAIPTITLFADVARDTTAQIELRLASRNDHQSPDTLLEQIAVPLTKGDRRSIEIRAGRPMPHEDYLYVTVLPNPDLRLITSGQRVTGILRLQNQRTERLSDLGEEDYPLFLPQRRPGGENLAFSLSSPIDCFNVANVLDGAQRPTNRPNAWVPDASDTAPSITVSWTSPQTLSQVDVFFDPDYDHPMETVLMGHPERSSPFCAKAFELLNDAGQVLAHETNWHHGRWSKVLGKPVQTRSLTLRITEPGAPGVPPAVFQIRAYNVDSMR